MPDKVRIQADEVKRLHHIIVKRLIDKKWAAVPDVERYRLGFRIVFVGYKEWGDVIPRDTWFGVMNLSMEFPIKNPIAEIKDWDRLVNGLRIIVYIKELNKGYG